MRLEALLVLMTSLAFGDDSYLGTDGGNIYPQKSTSVKMVKESVSIDLEKGGGLVTCTFWFFNSGKSDSIFVGFPDVQINPASITEPAKNFRAWVRGLEVMVKRDSLVETIDSGDVIKNSWYVWKVHFPSGDTTIVRNQYYGLWGGSYCEKSFSYIIGTGNSWLGPIGEGRVVFNFGKVFSSLFAGKFVWKDSGDLIPKYYDDSAVYEFKNYTPRNNERLDVWFSSYWGNVDSTKCPGFYIPTDSLKQKDDMINELFARYGNIFKSAQLNKMYSQKKWYVPKKHLKLEDLPASVQSYILNLKSGKDKFLSK